MITCKDCRFFSVDNTCRRFPPAGRPSCWPTLNANDWCGEFEAKKSMIALNEGFAVQCNVSPTTPKEPETNGMQALEEGVAPKIRVQKAKKPESLKDIQASPLFSGEQG